MKTKFWLLLLVRIVIGAVFIHASIDKILHPAAFAKMIHNYRLLPPFSINFLAIVLPWVEIASGICLITGFKYRSANLLILVMLVVFIGALGSAHARGLDINCGCFSVSPDVKSNLVVRIFEDILLLIGSLFIFVFARHPGSLQPLPREHS